MLSRRSVSWDVFSVVERLAAEVGRSPLQIWVCKTTPIARVMDSSGLLKPSVRLLASCSALNEGTAGDAVTVGRALTWRLLASDCSLMAIYCASRSGPSALFSSRDQGNWCFLELGSRGISLGGKVLLFFPMLGFSRFLKPLPSLQVLGLVLAGVCGGILKSFGSM